ncbi:MAG: hypothetical protein NT157_00260 [Candidatus Micrarchaeota archaeon]|nr:hypothetical protein [Candidatus Micrarchaeota archaeon]
MENIIKYFLSLLVLAVIIYGVFAVDYLMRGQSGTRAEYLASYLPDKDMSGITYITANEKGMEKIRESVGGALGSLMLGSTLKKIQTLDIILATYDDQYGDGRGSGDSLIPAFSSGSQNTVTVGLIGTAESIEDFLDSLPTYDTYGYEERELLFEEENIKGRTVYAVYSTSDLQRESPSCLWKEDAGIGFIMTSSAYYYRGIKMTCLGIMRGEFEHKNALALLEKSSEWSGKIPSVGEFIGEIRMAGGNSSLALRAYSDEDATYAIAVGLADASSFGILGTGALADNNICYSGYGQDMGVIEKDSKSACRMNSTLLFKTISLERIGEGNEMAVGIAFVEGGKKAVQNAGQKLENAIFSIDIGANDREWRTDIDVTLNVYEAVENGDYTYYYETGQQGSPLSGVKAELYVTESTQGDEGYYGSYAYQKDVLMETKYTDDFGKVTFNNVPLEGAKIALSKEGYKPEYSYSSGNQTVYVDQYMTTEYYFMKIVPREIKVSVYEDSDSYYGEERPIEGAIVGIYEYGKEPFEGDEALASGNTDSNGEIFFYNISDSVTVAVTREGYESDFGQEYETEFLSAQQTEASVYLVKIEPRTVTVKVYETMDTYSYSNSPLEGAKVDLYSRDQRIYEADWLTASNTTDSRGEAEFYNVTRGRFEANKAGYFIGGQSLGGFDEQVFIYLKKVGVDSEIQNVTCPDGNPGRLIESSAQWDLNGYDYWSRLSLNASTHPEIYQYRIVWFDGSRSQWYHPGQGDKDSKTNTDGSERLMWAYFDDHDHQMIICPADAPDPWP